MHRYLFFFPICLVLLFSACSSEDGQPSDDNSQAEEIKKITWEEIVLPNTTIVDNFAISDDGKYIFYTQRDNSIHRFEIASKQSQKLYGDLNATYNSYVHFIDGRLYTITFNNNKSYFSTSTNNGNTFTRSEVATLVPFTPYVGFLKVDFNRLFKMPNGTLILPDLISTTVDRISISSDGGAKWANKKSSLLFIHAQQGNRLFATPGSWQGDFGIGSSGGGLHFSDDMGNTWTKSDLKYPPLATDREGNLIGATTNQIQRLKGGKWTLYEWDGNFPFGVSLINRQSGTTLTQRVVDIEFDQSNHLYLLSGSSKGSGNSIYKTKLN